MSAIYSSDLRMRVINLHLIHQHKVDDVAQLMDIPIQTVYRWISEAKMGIVEPKTGYQNGHSHKITDLVKFKEFIDQNEHDSLRMLAKKLNISKDTVAEALKKINYSKKKDQKIC